MTGELTGVVMGVRNGETLCNARIGEIDLAREVANVVRTGDAAMRIEDVAIAGAACSYRLSVLNGDAARTSVHSVLLFGALCGEDAVRSCASVIGRNVRTGEGANQRTFGDSRVVVTFAFCMLRQACIGDTHLVLVGETEWNTFGMGAAADTTAVLLTTTLGATRPRCWGASSSIRPLVYSSGSPSTLRNGATMRYGDTARTCLCAIVVDCSCASLS